MRSILAPVVCSVLIVVFFFFWQPVSIVFFELIQGNGIPIAGEREATRHQSGSQVMLYTPYTLVHKCDYDDDD